MSPPVMPMLMTHLTGTWGSFIRRASPLNERRWDRENTTVTLMRLRFINRGFTIPGPFSSERLSILSRLIVENRTPMRISERKREIYRSARSASIIQCRRGIKSSAASFLFSSRINIGRLRVTVTRERERACGERRTSLIESRLAAGRNVISGVSSADFHYKDIPPRLLHRGETERERERERDRDAPPYYLHV